jgi:hypothetical protein
LEASVRAGHLAPLGDLAGISLIVPSGIVPLAVVGKEIFEMDGRYSPGQHLAVRSDGMDAVAEHGHSHPASKRPRKPPRPGRDAKQDSSRTSPSPAFSWIRLPLRHLEQKHDDDAAALSLIVQLGSRAAEASVPAFV